MVDNGLLTAHPGDRLHLVVRDAAGEEVLVEDVRVRGVWRNKGNQVLTLTVTIDANRGPAAKDE